MRPGTTRICAVLCMLAALAPPAFAQRQREPKLDRYLQNAHGGSKERVIVRLKPGTSVEGVSKGRKVFAKHASIDAVTLEVRADELAALARNPNVESIGADAELGANATTSSTIPPSVLRETLGVYT